MRTRLIAVLFLLIAMPSGLSAQSCPSSGLLICDGRVFGTLDAAYSCRYQNFQYANIYTFFLIDARTYVTFTMESSSFKPLVIVYDGGDHFLGADRQPQANKSTVTLLLPYAGEYRVAAAGANPYDAGPFTLTAACSTKPPCQAPAVLSGFGQTDFSVRRGATLDLSQPVTGTSILIYQWFDGRKGDKSRPMLYANAVLKTPPIDSEKWYWFLVSNECGQAESDQFHITVLPDHTRRRTVRH